MRNNQITVTRGRSNSAISNSNSPMDTLQAMPFVRANSLQPCATRSWIDKAQPRDLIVEHMRPLHICQRPIENKLPNAVVASFINQSSSCIFATVSHHRLIEVYNSTVTYIRPCYSSRLRKILLIFFATTIVQRHFFQSIHYAKHLLNTEPVQNTINHSLDHQVIKANHSKTAKAHTFPSSHWSVRVLRFLVLRFHVAPVRFRLGTPRFRLVFPRLAHGNRIRKMVC